MIPKILHFCFGMSRDYKPWSLCHYACVRSAVERIKPDAAYLYFQHEPQGPYWNLVKELITPVRIEAPQEIFGNPLLHPAHRADIVRLEKLIEHGGIYLDVDVFVHRDFDNLLNNSVVLGREGGGPDHAGLCNAVILAEPNAPFLRRWYQEYKTFRSKGRDAFWNEHSVLTPLRLANEFPGEATMLPPTAFFWPMWDRPGLDLIFKTPEPLELPDAYATHLWESFAWYDFLRDLTPGRVRRVESNFHRWLRPLVKEFPDNYGAPGLGELSQRKLKALARRVGSFIGTVRRAVD